MWNTGKESLPSFMPRVDRMTEIKWMHVLSSKGAELDLVRSCNVVRQLGVVHVFRTQELD